MALGLVLYIYRINRQHFQAFAVQKSTKYDMIWDGYRKIRIYVTAFYENGHIRDEEKRIALNESMHFPRVLFNRFHSTIMMYYNAKILMYYDKL